jgi:hypothetical protein
LNLAREGRKRSWSDLELEPVTGGLYMLFLARKMADRRNLVTDSPVYQSLLFQEAGKVDHGYTDRGQEFRLATAVIRTAVPSDSIPIDRLLRIRGDLSDQRRRFQDKVASLASELTHFENEEELQRAILAHQRRFEDDYEELTDRLRSKNISFLTNLFAVSVPSWATATWGMNIKVMNFALGAIGAVALSGIVINNLFDRKTLLRTNPMAYLLTLRKRVTPYTMAEGIASLNLSFPLENDSIRRVPRRYAGGRLIGRRCMK